MCNVATFNLVFYAMMIDFLYVQVEILGAETPRTLHVGAWRAPPLPSTAKQIKWTGLGMLGKRRFQNHNLFEVIKGI